MNSRDKKQKEEDVKLMKDPASWHRWPILPVKKIVGNGERPEFGFLLAMGKPIVYMKNMYGLVDLGVKTVKEIMEKVDGKEYPSFDSIVEDGWVID